MAQFQGTTALNSLFLGTTPIQVLYQGTVIVWQNEIVVVLTTAQTNYNPATAFGADWAAAKNKRLINDTGNSINGLVINSAFGGNFIIQNRGTISGAGGTGSGGVGGNAITNTTGITIALINSGTIQSGGGGGGSGQTSGTVTEGPFGPSTAYRVTNNPQVGLTLYIWNSTTVAQAPLGTQSANVPPYLYFVANGSGAISRSYSATTPTSGGRGQGYDGAAASGGTNAGAGGAYGANGSAGSVSAGGLAGFAYSGAFSVTNTGTVLGRT